MMQIPTAEFKQQLVHLRSDFNMYLKEHKSKGIPLQHLVILLQKYIKIQPSSLETLLSRTITNNEVTWQHLLMYMEQEIGLEDQVNKMKVTKPSIIDIHYFADPDERLKQSLYQVQMYIKKKSTNYIKFVKKAEFLGFKLLVVALERQAIFYDCEDKCIIRHVQFKYNNVRSKILNNLHMKEKHYDQYNSSFLRIPHNDQARNHSYKRQQNQEVDKVPPMSRRTEEHPHSFSLKSHKNTNQSEELKNMITNNMKVSKVGSSASADEQSNFDNIKRSVTMMDYSIRNSLHRDITKVHKFGSIQNNSIKLKDQKNRKEILKVRSSDTANILKLITDCKVEGSMEVIKAYRNSIETFQKYVQIDKNKLEKQKQLFEQYKLPSAINMKFDYKTEIKKMKTASKQLSMKKNTNNDNSQSSVRSSYKNHTKTKVRTQTSPGHQDQHFFTLGEEQKLDSSNAFVGLEKKILQIQSISFCQNYMLVSLMNCELRLYSFKRTIHGFSEELVFEKSYHSLVTDVLIYKSSVRKLYNICVILSKVNNHESNANTSQKDKQQDIRNIQTGPPKHKQTEILVYQLSHSMTIEKQSYMTYLPYSPIICNVLPLGVGGYLESGNFFVIQLNCTSTPKSEIKSIDTVLTNPEHGQRVSISCLKVHRDLVNFYIGSKDGEVYVYDKLIDNVRTHKKIANCEIVQLMFVSDWKEVMFWDVSGKVGVFNANNLGVSSVVSLMGPIGRGVGGNSNGGGYWGMVSYFLENEFLVYGDRTIGLVSLFENQQKKFHAEKSMKIYNRRLAIKNRTKINSQNLIVAQQMQTQKANNNKKVHKYFSSPEALILLSSSGEILVHDKSSLYIGSYFTLNYVTVTQSICCPSLKYLYLLHENNDMQVVNIYTQEEVLFLTNIKEEVYDIFFCHSSVYFCGYLTSTRYQLQLYGYGNGNGRGSDAGYVGPLISVNMCSVILDLPPVQVKDKDRDSKFSKVSNISLSTNSCNIDMDIKLYKGSMVLLKKQSCQVVFLYKKTYTRNCVIKCLQHTKNNTHQQFQTITISHTFVDLQASLLTVILSNFAVLFINLQAKSVRTVFKLQCSGSPIEHYFESSSNLIAILSKTDEESYQYSLYRIQESTSLATLLYSIDHEPNENNSQFVKSTKIVNQSKLRKLQKQPLTDNQPRLKWASRPFLVGKDFATLNQDQNSFNVYKIRTIGSELEQKTKGKLNCEVEYSKIEVE